MLQKSETSFYLNLQVSPTAKHLQVQRVVVASALAEDFKLSAKAEAPIRKRKNVKIDAIQNIILPSQLFSIL